MNLPFPPNSPAPLPLCSYPLTPSAILPLYLSPQPYPVRCSPMPTVLLINANSKRGQEMFEAAQEALKNVGFHDLEPHAVSSLEESTAVLKAAIARGDELVVVGGGDGTLSSSAHVLAGSETALGVLPLGTGNTFARGLELPLDLEGAAKVLAKGEFARVDVGRVNGRIFINSVSLGASEQIASSLDGDLKKKLGLLAWPVAAFKALRGRRPMRLELRTDHLRLNVRTRQLLIANNSNIASFVTAPGASLQNGQLETLVLGSESFWSLIKAGWNLLLKRSSKSDIHSVFGPTIEVRSLGKVRPANVDGDILTQTPLKVDILPRALRVVVPLGSSLLTEGKMLEFALERERADAKG